MTTKATTATKAKKTPAKKAPVVKEVTLERPALPEVRLTDNERAKILDDIFANGKTTKTIEVLPGKLKAVIRNLSAEGLMELDELIANLKGTPTQVLHQYSLALLARTVPKYNQTTFDSTESAYAYLKVLPGSVVDKIVKEQNYFERQVREAIQLDNLENHFFETPSTPNE